MQFLDNIKQWIREITNVGLLLIGLGIVIQVLFGSQIFVTGDIISNIIGIVDRLGNAGLAGLIALVIIVWVLARRSPG